MTGRDFGPAGAAPARAPRPPVQTGLDVLRAQGFAPLRRQARRAGHESHRPRPRRRHGDRSAVRRDGREAGRALQSRARHPRHARRDGPVSEVDEKTKLPINSRSTARRAVRPPRCSRGSTRSSIDLQDIGSRFWTYMTTTAYVMEEAAKRKLPVFVLDRPNPVNGWQIEGPALDKESMGVHRLLRVDADPPRHDARRAGEAVQRREQDRRRPDRGGDEELAPRRLVRRHRRCRGSTRRPTCAT